MIPKEKAEELLDKYSCLDGSTESGWFLNSKDCALICVNELIEHCSQVEPLLGVDYWNEVKSEIEKYDTERI